MANLAKNFFMALSNNRFLNESAQKWGFRLGAEQFVAGTDIESALETVKQLNALGISATVDHLGEFVTDKQQSIEAKENILTLINRIHEEQIDSHISVKLTQLGLDIDEQFCLENMREIAGLAKRYDIFINIDMEDYAHYEATLRILKKLLEDYDNVGTVIQAYLYRAEADMDELSDVRLRIVKGAYKESEEVAYQSKEKIDENFLKLVKKRLKGDAFTSIATHDHRIIDEVKRFVEEENIDRTNFEFQMLYGFRTELQKQLVDEGYQFCTYVPFGQDWFGYFMRRLAERPQNIQLIVKDKLYTKDNKLKRKPLVVGSAALAALLFMVWRRNK